MATIPVSQTPTAVVEIVEEKFQRLARLWREAAPIHPRAPVNYGHQAYQAIIGMGTEVVPYLLRALGEEHRHWFWALHSISGANPIAPDDQGSATKMTQAWLRWGQENGNIRSLTGLTIVNGDNPSALTPNAVSHAVPKESLNARFKLLAAIWKAESAYLSSTTAMVNHPAYQEIIHLGPDVVPLLLQELERQPDHWSMALKSLTGADPIEPAHRGQLANIAKDWLLWGRDHGYQW